MFGYAFANVSMERSPEVRRFDRHIYPVCENHLNSGSQGRRFKLIENHLRFTDR
jgi:hypothetical protein